MESESFLVDQTKWRNDKNFCLSLRVQMRGNGIFEITIYTVRIIFANIWYENERAIFFLPCSQIDYIYSVRKGRNANFLFTFECMPWFQDWCGSLYRWTGWIVKK
jgi:hypothetical protein